MRLPGGWDQRSKSPARWAIDLILDPRTAGRHCPANRTAEGVVALVIHEHLKAALVDQPMMVVAQQHQVVETRPAPLRPVLHMMGVHEPAMAVARKPAMPVPAPERPSKRLRYGPPLAADVEPAIASVKPLLPGRDHLADRLGLETRPVQASGLGDLSAALHQIEIDQEK